MERISTEPLSLASAALQHLATLAQRGADSGRMQRETEAIVAGWFDAGHGARREALEILRDQLVTAAEETAAQVADLDRTDTAGIRAGQRVLAGLEAARRRRPGGARGASDRRRAPGLPPLVMRRKDASNSQEREPALRIFHPLRSPRWRCSGAACRSPRSATSFMRVALTWIAVGVLGAGAGYLRALQALVLVVAALGIGGWADRWDQRRSMIRADLARAAILLLLVTAWMATGRPSAAMLIAAVMVLAVGQAVFQPALQTLLPELVSDRGLLPAANGLLDATDRSARLLGPGLIALLAGLVPVMHFMTIDAASFLLSAAALLLIRRLRPDLPPLQRGGRRARSRRHSPRHPRDARPPTARLFAGDRRHRERRLDGGLLPRPAAADRAPRRRPAAAGSAPTAS